MRYLLLAVVHTMLFSSLAWAAPTVFLKDGSKVTGNSVWQEGGKVYLSKSKELYEFSQDDVKLQETMKFNRIGTYRDVSVEARHTPSAPVPKKVRRPAKAAVAPAATVKAVAATATAKPATAASAPATAMPPAPKPAAPAATVNVPSAPTQPTAVEPQKEPAPAPAPSAIPQPSAGFPVAVLVISLVICLILVAANWMIFEKAGEAGWKCLVPIYNMYILIEVAGKPWWWFLLLFVPLVGAVIYLLAMLSLAKKFGRSELFGVGLFLLPMIFMPLLAFSDSQYQG